MTYKYYCTQLLYKASCMTKTIIVHDDIVARSTVRAQLQTSITTSEYLQSISNLIRRDHPTPMYTILICNHPFTTKRHPADGPTRHHCHRSVNPRLWSYSKTEAFFLSLSQTSALSSLLLTIHIILKTFAMTMDYWDTKTYAHKLKLHQGAYSSRSADKYLTLIFLMLFGVPWGVRNDKKLSLLHPGRCYF